MKYLCKVTKTDGQSRITLPKKFIELNSLEDEQYFVIDDKNRNNIQIRGFDNGKASKR